jgi:hypothetical protein
MVHLRIVVPSDQAEHALDLLIGESRRRPGPTAGTGRTTST